MRLDEFSQQLDHTNKRLDDLKNSIDFRLDEFNTRLNDTNKRIDRLFEAVVRREDH